MEKIGKCDECMAEDALYDAILNGRAVRLCRRCLDMSNALEIKRNQFQEMPDVPGPSTKEVLFRMSGLNQNEWSGKEGERKSLENVNLDYLRMKKRERDLAMKAEKERKEREAAAAAIAVKIETHEKPEKQEKPEHKSPSYWEILQKRKQGQMQQPQQAQPQQTQSQGQKIELIYSEQEMPDNPEEPKKSGFFGMFKKRKKEEGETSESVSIDAVNTVLANEKL